MISHSEVIAAAMADFGEVATVTGKGSLTVMPVLADHAQLDNGQIERIGPYCWAWLSEVEALDVYYGNDGDTLTIGAIDYTILAIHPDGQGLVTMTLEDA
jgi:hypothetical protein